VFTRSGSTWSQQGVKLVGSGATSESYQGTSVALSADGNTAIIGARFDNNATGAAWVFARSAGTWSQQGAKLVGSNGGDAQQGWSVAVSADGNTMLSGGYADSSNHGAVWVFTRSGGTWSQQGTKLTGSGTAVAPTQGMSVGLSADGNTAIFGGPAENTTGATWVFTRSSGTWTQHGAKLVGTGAAGTSPGEGWASALSADGYTAVIGGAFDHSATGAGTNYGATWVFTQ
jgi:hypothetical protein